MLSRIRMSRKSRGCWKHGIFMLGSFQPAPGWRAIEKSLYKVNSEGIHNSAKLKETTIVSNLDSSNNAEQTKGQIDFTNYDFQNAFSFRSTGEIFRSYLIFSLCSYPILVNNSMKLMTYGQNILGKRIFENLMRKTLYGQFVGGQTESEFLLTARQLTKIGIGTLLAVPMEEDATGNQTQDNWYDENANVIQRCIKLCATMNNNYPMMQLKITAVVPADICARLSAAFPEPSANPETVKDVARVFAEGREFHHNSLSSYDTESLNRGLKRLKAIAKCAAQHGVLVLVDAEYTYVNPALNLLTLAMVMQYNRDRPIISYTYQNYLKSTFHTLKKDAELISSNGLCFGAKLVRGAYMEKERHLAAKKGYPDPVHETFESTSNMYHQSLYYLLDFVKGSTKSGFVMVASHNEQTIKKTIERMRELSLNPKEGNVFFGQVYGMCDHVSAVLGQNGYLVYKSIPYGSIEATLPYLHRRALENKAVIGSTRRDREIAREALIQRFKQKMFPTRLRKSDITHP
ncbi:hypothetical protein ACJMK2_015570 [Sinanodonta woodiana]|uniref:Proline dehydrogenase n=1 Tax=Sinanodonta woodiana TaxID=1069815 RepID=A0ABD3UR27_SINWO